MKLLSWRSSISTSYYWSPYRGPIHSFCTGNNNLNFWIVNTHEISKNLIAQASCLVVLHIILCNQTWKTDHLCTANFITIMELMHYLSTVIEMPRYAFKTTSIFKCLNLIIAWLHKNVYITSS